jgi:hypothetical protein
LHVGNRKHQTISPPQATIIATGFSTSIPELPTQGLTGVSCDLEELHRRSTLPSRAAQLTFPRDAFVLLMLALDPILVLLPIVGKPLGDLVWPSRRGEAFSSIRIELHELSDAELVHSDHSLPVRWGSLGSFRF